MHKQGFLSGYLLPALFRSSARTLQPQPQPQPAVQQQQQRSLGSSATSTTTTPATAEQTTSAHARQRRDSTGSTGSEGSTGGYVAAGAGTWYIGGRNADGQERFYQLHAGRKFRS